MPVTNEKSVKTEYFKDVRSALSSKLNAGNVFQTIDIWAIPTVFYGAGLIQWTKEEFQQMNRKTRKLITIYGGAPPIVMYRQILYTKK